MDEFMTRAELAHVKAMVQAGVIINKETWLRVLDTAIETADDLYVLCDAEGSYAAAHGEGE